MRPSRTWEGSTAEPSDARRRRPSAKLLLAVLATAIWGCWGPAAAMSPPPEQSAANCSTPTYASDQLVCADPSLLALDHRMLELLAAAGTAARGPALHWFEPQEEWFRRRSLCAFTERHAACLRAAYRERTDLLAVLAGNGSGQRGQDHPLSCPGAPWGNGAVRLQANDQGTLTIEDARGRVLVVASGLQPRDDWLPFLRIVNVDEGIRIETIAGRVVRCRLLKDRRPGQVAPQRNRPQ